MRKWQRWFAWYPVRTAEYRLAWFRRTWRFWEVIWDGYWVYSDKPDFSSHAYADTLNPDGTRCWRP
jgi:hypothetical protein